MDIEKDLPKTAEYFDKHEPDLFFIFAVIAGIGIILAIQGGFEIGN
ncbi:MAG: hypothetical protein ACOCQE_04775 [Halanaerobium sp.]